VGGNEASYGNKRGEMIIGIRDHGEWLTENGVDYCPVLAFLAVHCWSMGEEVVSNAFEEVGIKSQMAKEASW